MTERANCSYLSVADRVWLLKSAIEMIEEALSEMYHEAVDAGVDSDDDNLHDSLDEMRAMSFMGLLRSMAITDDEGDARALVRLMRLDQEAETDDF